MKHIFFLIALLPSMLIAQHTIKGMFTPADRYKMVLLYEVTPTNFKYISSYEIKNDGKFQFKMDPIAAKGIYRVVYAIPQEDYNFDIIYNGKEDIEILFNSETGVKFIKSVENKLLSSYINSMSLATQSISNYYNQKPNTTAVLESIYKNQRETQAYYEKAAKDMMALQFIKANKPYIPKKAEDVKTYVANLKKHYFDYMDFNNPMLQSSNFLDEKIASYVFGASDDSKDEITNYKNNMDVVYNKMKEMSLETKRIKLFDLWQQMVDLNIESTANYIAEAYLMDIAVALNDQKLLHALIVYKDTSLGSKAPDFSFEFQKEKSVTTKKLSELNVAQNYIILFWSSTCSHCLEAVPKLRAYINKLKKGFVKVVAIGLEDEPKEWQTVIKKFPEFIHVYGKGKWDNEISQNYGVSGTPSYFVLNKNKEIIAKPENLTALKAFFESQK